MKMKDYIQWIWLRSEGLRLRILSVSITGILHVAVSLLFIKVSKQLIDAATGQIEGDMARYMLYLIACVVLQMLFSVANSRIEAKSEIQLRCSIRQQLFDHLMRTRWTGREAMHTGDMLNRLEEDVYLVSDTICSIIPNIIITLVRLLGAFLLLSEMDIRLALILLIIMPIALVLSKSYIKRMRRLNAEIAKTNSGVQSHVQEQLQHRTLISTLEYTSHAVSRLFALQSSLQSQVMKRTDVSLFSRTIVHIGFTAGYITAFLWGVYGLNDETVTFGMMTAFLQLVGQVQRPMVDLSRQVPKFIRLSTSIDRLKELLALPLEEQGEPIKLKGTAGLRFEDVTFAYPDGDRKIVEHFSHDFKPGSLTAIVGETGAGKSTLIRMMLALLLPEKGKISIYDRERTITASPLTRCNLIYVPQGNTLISGTIKENLLIGKPNATDAELRAALHTAVADFVDTLPNGLDTICGEQGAGLSEGQAQRIAIARGLLRPGGILLLDEPTSALDHETEQLLLDRLAQRVQDKTLILITHRDTIANLCLEVIRI